MFPNPKGIFFTVVFLSGSVIPSPAQTPSDVIGTIGGLADFAIKQSAQADWQKVSKTELNCINQEVSVGDLINKGIRPSDSRLRGIRTKCSDASANSGNVTNARQGPSFGQVRATGDAERELAQRAIGEAKSAWSALTDKEQSCVERSLLPRSDIKTISGLIQAGVTPTDPRISGAVTQCRQQQAQAQNPSEQFNDPGRRAQPPEQKLALLMDMSWSDIKGSAMCRSRIHEQRKSCLAARGTNLTVEIAQSCQLKITETIPPNPDLPKTWDGKVARDEILGRELFVSLRSLKPELIKKSAAAGLDLYFVIDPKGNPIQRIKLASKNDWIPLPLPPSNVPNFVNAFMKWNAEINLLGDPNILGFAVVGDGSGLSFIRWEGGHILDDGRNESTVETIQQIIAKCT